MSLTTRFLLLALVVASLGGCVAAPLGPPTVTTKPMALIPKKEPTKLTSHFIGVATLSDADAKQAEVCLKTHGIAYGEFVDLTSTGVVVDVGDADRARKLIREDAWNHGYKLLERVTPTPERSETVQFTKGNPIIPKNWKPLPNAPNVTPPRAIPAKSSMKLVTVVAVNDKDMRAAINCLKANGITAPGTWQSQGVSGIVVPESDAKKALALIQLDAKQHHYTLLSTQTRGPDAEPLTVWPGKAPKDDDSTAEGSLIVFARERDASKIAECLENHSISSFSSCNRNSCGVYVSKHDADLALAYVQEDARTNGYEYTSSRIHYAN